jgi:hypothetical protein
MNRTRPPKASDRFSSVAWAPERRAAQAALMASINANPEFAARRDFDHRQQRRRQRANGRATKTRSLLRRIASGVGRAWRP